MGEFVVRWCRACAACALVPALVLCASLCDADFEAKLQLKSAYRTSIDEAEPERKNEAGRDLIRAIFWKDSIAEDSIR